MKRLGQAVSSNPDVVLSYLGLGAMFALFLIRFALN